MSNYVTLLPNFFSTEELDQILNSQEVQQNYEKCIDPASGGQNAYLPVASLNEVRFSIPISPEVERRLLGYFPDMQLDEQKRSIPMRWTIGNIHPHVDRSSKPFEKSIVIYLTTNADSTFEVHPSTHTFDTEIYLIEKNKALIFSKDLRHSVVSTHQSPRLMMGPFSSL